ncbi:hypothetical protein N658DRAFT_249602 [Parathielavia hyrcaniae]|uniref:Uncharacterized protein n=1 Tax=Parathielavia hyrcaniae TaxID=113614 RepID=A0AAN6Q659_9PEZI|nr:hypothetical protein N658DRAFT_249602 [Parathielavia hyrcaniae]
MSVSRQVTVEISSLDGGVCSSSTAHTWVLNLTCTGLLLPITLPSPSRACVAVAGQRGESGQSNLEKLATWLLDHEVVVEALLELKPGSLSRHPRASRGASRGAFVSQHNVVHRKSSCWHHVSISVCRQAPIKPLRCFVPASRLYLAYSGLGNPMFVLLGACSFDSRKRLHGAASDSGTSPRWVR